MPESAQSSKLRINLNLLHPREQRAKLPQKFLKWLISYGRFIVILVEVVVVAAFLARFKYDADLDVLKRKINQDLPYVQNLATDEALIDQAQSRLALIDKTLTDADQWQATITNLSSLTPISIQFLSLSLDQKDDGGITFKINAATRSNTDLGIFLNTLRTQGSFKDIVLTNIEFEHDQILFSITGINSAT